MRPRLRSAPRHAPRQGPQRTRRDGAGIAEGAGDALDAPARDPDPRGPRSRRDRRPAAQPRSAASARGAVDPPRGPAAAPPRPRIEPRADSDDVLPGAVL